MYYQRRTPRKADLTAALILLLTACGGTTESSTPGATNGSGPWENNVPYDLELSNWISFVDEEGDFINGSLSLQPNGKLDANTFLYTPWVTGVVPSMKVFTPNGAIDISINLADYSPYLEAEGSIGPAWYSSDSRDIHVIGSSPAMLFDGLDTWPVRVSVNFSLNGESPILFTSALSTSGPNSISIAGDPDFGISSNEVIGYTELFSVELAL